MSFIRKIEISLACSMLLTMIISLINFAGTSDRIRDSVLRLHIIANSDTQEDQMLKLIVRDKLLSCGENIFDGSVNIDNAQEKLTNELSGLEETAEKTIKELGYNYDVTATLEREYFSTRTYETVTLPAGEYLALKVTIGEGTGKNWWCVMFPPMCISAADETDVLSDFLNEKEIRLISKRPEYEPRFKILELFEKAKQKFNK